MLDAQNVSPGMCLDNTSTVYEGVNMAELDFYLSIEKALDIRNSSTKPVARNILDDLYCLGTDHTTKGASSKHSPEPSFHTNPITNVEDTNKVVLLPPESRIKLCAKCQVTLFVILLQNPFHMLYFLIKCWVLVLTKPL